MCEVQTSQHRTLHLVLRTSHSIVPPARQPHRQLVRNLVIDVCDFVE